MGVRQTVMLLFEGGALTECVSESQACLHMADIAQPAEGGSTNLHVRHTQHDAPQDTTRHSPCRTPAAFAKAAQRVRRHMIAAAIQVLSPPPPPLPPCRHRQVIAKHGPKLTPAALDAMTYTDAVIK